MGETDMILLALCLAFVGFAILVIVTLLSARLRPPDEDRQMMERDADWLKRMIAREEAARRHEPDLTLFDDGT